MAHWITDVENKVFTYVSYKVKNALKTKYPSIYFTTDSEDSTDTNFPTVYIHYLPTNERGQDLEGCFINAYLCSMQIDVTVSKDQGQQGAKEVMWSVIDTLKQLSFDIFQMPEFMETGNTTKRIVARARREFGYNDYIG